MTWLAIIGALMKLALAMLNWASERKQIAAAEAEVAAAHLQEAINGIRKVRATRDAVGRKFDADPGLLPNNDPNRRD